MIKLLDNWIIDTDDLSYLLVKESGKIRHKGKRSYRERKIYGYYPTLESALRAFREMLLREELSYGELSLPEAINVIRRIDEVFSKMIGNATGTDCVEEVLREKGRHIQV